MSLFQKPSITSELFGNPSSAPRPSVFDPCPTTVPIKKHVRGPPPTIPPELKGLELVYGYELNEDLVKNHPRYIEFKQNKNMTDFSLINGILFEAAAAIGLNCAYMVIDPYEFRIKTDHPEASKMDLVYFANTLCGYLTKCVAEDVLEELREALKTDIKPRWIIV
ncbi:hypothetical protein K435DRAFT_866726 [Dendrothele bispora CBS 962.96]|uniref:Uncharacterized protein n=1 Tax=Dendrothele bispora (strain CBS 962.96) TaxID=1314807 RepID=A0A4S8LG69_DENBC|nr:hypothetical protein K435DRAFT_866726 [Dendrothele bispora CBS 962.96]